MIATLDRARQVVDRHGTEDSQSGFGTNVGHAQEQPKHTPVRFGGEAKQIQRIFANVGVDPQFHVRIRIDPGTADRADGRRHFIANAVNVQHDRARRFVGEYSTSKTTDHAIPRKG